MTITRDEVVSFLYKEAKLLDEWRLLEWAELFDEDGTYTIPPLENPEADPGKSIFFVNDNRSRLKERAERLLKKEAHVEYPHSKTIRNIHNIKIKDLNSRVISVECNFTTYRTKREVIDSFIGRQEYKIITNNNQLRIKSKKVVLNLDSLRPHGKISLIL